jgi:hypothetical protein
MSGCTAGSLCLELAKGAPAAFVALVIGLVAAGIAWRQHAVAQTKLKLDLFDRRYQVFERAWKFLSEVVQTGPGDGLGDYASEEFTDVIPQAGFLFGGEIQDYLHRVMQKRKELWAIRSRIKSNRCVTPLEDIERQQDLMIWFYEQAVTGVRSKFAPYLDLQELR